MHPLHSAWEAVKEQFDSACSQSARAARWGLTNDLNQLLRRLRQYRDEAEWISILLEAVARIVGEVAIFEVASAGVAPDSSPQLRLRAQSGLQLPGELSFPASDGAAFAAVLLSRDPSVAMRTASEVTPLLAQAARDGDQNGQHDSGVQRCYVLPITNGDRVAVMVFAAGSEYVDMNALELICGLGSAVLERNANRQLHLQVAPPPIVAKAPSPEPPAASSRHRQTLPRWADLPELERTRHVQAQRFARVTVAELQLAHPDACRNGRDSKNLYLYLKGDLDKAREKFRRNFMEIPSMVDYLHMELVSTAASGDESKLGVEYPGPLV